MRDSKEAKALLKCHTQLVAVVQNNLNDIALCLRQQEIIDKPTYDIIIDIKSVFGGNERARMAVRELDNKIQEDKNVFFKFLKYLSSKERYMKLTSSLVDEYEKLGGIVDPAILKQEQGQLTGPVNTFYTVNWGSVMSNDACRVIAVLVACCIILFVIISRIISSSKETVYLVEKEQELSTYLQEIADWDSLCTNLGVDQAIMANLQMGTQKDHLKKKECLANYFESGRAKWNDVVKVVAKFPFFKKALACRIAERFMNMDRDYCLDQYLLQKDEF